MVAVMKSLCLCSALILLAIPAHGQETGDEKPPRLLVCVESVSTPPHTDAELTVASKSISFALKASSERLIVVEYGTRGFPETTEGRKAVCRELRTDGWLWVGLAGERSSPVLRVSAYNAVSGETVLEGSFQRDRGLSLLDIVEEQWQEFVPAVAGYFGSRSSQSASRRESNTAGLTLRALPGTRITGIPGDPIVVGEEGAVTPGVAAPGTYSIRAELLGYYPASLSVYLVADRDVSITQEPGSRWAFDLSFFNSLYPGGNAAFFILPNWIFARFEAMSYILGLSLGPEYTFSSFPLFVFNLGFGGYLAPEDFVFRPYIALGGFLRVSWIWGYAPAIEPLSPVGISMDLGLEFPISAKLAYYFEYVPLLYFTGTPALFMASLMSADNQFGYIPFPFGVLSSLNFRFGFRWML